MLVATAPEKPFSSLARCTMIRIVFYTLIVLLDRFRGGIGEVMKTPPMLVGAALLFWGWADGLPILKRKAVIGAAAGRCLRFVKTVGADESKISAAFGRFCTVLFLATAAYALLPNDGLANVRRSCSPTATSPRKTM